MTYFIGSGGVFLHSGDEFGQMNASCVFNLQNGTVVPFQETLLVLRPEHEIYNILQECLRKQAKAKILKSEFSEDYITSTEENKKLFEAPYMTWLQQQLIAGEEKAIAPISKLLMQEAQIDKSTVDFLLKEKIPTPCIADTLWRAPVSISTFLTDGVFKDFSNILSKMPPSKSEYFAESYWLKDELLAFVRCNGNDNNAEVDVIVINASINNSFSLSQKDLHQLACYHQMRLFPENAGKLCYYNTHKGKEAFHQAYFSIMGSSEQMRAPAFLHVGPGIVVEPDVQLPFKDNPTSKERYRNKL